MRRWWSNPSVALAVLLPSLTTIAWRRGAPLEAELPASGTSPGSIEDASPVRLRRPALRGLGLLLLVSAGCLAARQGHQDAIGEWGLVQALPTAYFGCVALLSLSFMWELLSRHARPPWVLAAHLVGLVVLLHGAPALLEREPRFPTAWLHVGFVSQVLHHHVAPGTVEARFNWPGFFGAAAAVTGAGGLDSALPLLRWAPVVVVLVYLLPLHLIGRQLTGSATATWLGLWLFVLVNWVGQDYFAPQSLGFVLFLTAVALLVCFYREPSPESLSDPRTTWPAKLLVGIERLPFDGLPDVRATRRVRQSVIALLLGIVVAVSMSHQLTPIMFTLAVAALVLVGRCRLTVLPVLAGLVTIAWISVGTTDYWIGHLGTIFGGVGNVQAVVSNSVGERVGGSPVHLAVVKLRLALTATVWLLMGVAALGLWLRRKPPLTLFALSIAPFLTLAQNYGTEGVLRIFLFSSPFAALLVAQFAVTGWQLRWVRWGVTAVAVALVPVFLVTRYGNESFEQVRTSEVQALRTLYATAPEGSVFLSPASQVPWRFQQAVEQHYHRPAEPDAFMSADPRAVRNPGGGEPEGDGRIYLIVTRSQILYGYEALGFRRDWFDHLRPLLNRRNGYDLRLHNKDTWIYEFEGQR